MSEAVRSGAVLVGALVGVLAAWAALLYGVDAVRAHQERRRQLRRRYSRLVDSGALRR